ncbi:hypothetical protein [Deinococcus murrayi]|uniref:hypothetical protein n=1 Tax=Deinococcus murrayi TaxID=68910 RepID=UPI001FDF5B52|nr:hypothetical protein [Deinococcus murrayi]
MIAAFFSSLCSSGINISATVNISALTNKKNILVEECQRFYNLGYLLSLASALLYLVLSGFLSYYSNSGVFSNFISHVLLSVYIFAVGFDAMQLGVAFGLGVFQKLALANLVKAATLLGSMIVASSGGSYYAVLLALAFSWTLNLMVNKSVIENHLGVKIAFSRGKFIHENKSWLMSVLVFSLPLILSALITSGSIALSNHMAANLANGFLLVGIAALGRQWIFIHQFIPAQLSNMALPKLSRLRSDNSSFSKGSGLYMFGSVSLGLLIGALAIVVAWVFKDNLLASLKIDFVSALVFIIAGFLAVVNNTLGYILVSFGNTKARLRADFVMGAALLIATYTLLRYEPSIAMPWAIALAFACAVAELLIEIAAMKGKLHVT